jgi:hypothetical protein
VNVVVMSAITLLGVGAVVGPARADLPRPNPIANASFELQADADARSLVGVGPVEETAYWYTGPDSNAHVSDVNGDGDREAVIEGAGDNVPVRDLFQVAAPPLQTATLDFDSVGFSIEAGSIAPGANIRLGFALTPLYEAHPYALVFNEGSLVFPARAMVPDASGRVTIDSLAGSIDCPVDQEGRAWMPCEHFRSEFNAASGDGAAQRSLLGRARIVEVDLGGFAGLPAGERIVIDDIELAGDRSVAERAAQTEGIPTRR